MMGMTLGLDKPGQCTQASLEKAKKLVPKALEPYVVDIFNGVGRGEDTTTANAGREGRRVRVREGGCERDKHTGICNNRQTICVNAIFLLFFRLYPLHMG